MSKIRRLRGKRVRGFERLNRFCTCFVVWRYYLVLQDGTIFYTYARHCGDLALITKFQLPNLRYSELPPEVKDYNLYPNKRLNPVGRPFWFAGKVYELQYNSDIPDARSFQQAFDRGRRKRCL